MFKKHLASINKEIEQFLCHHAHICHKSGFVKERKKFYELKKK